MAELSPEAKGGFTLKQGMVAAVAAVALMGAAVVAEHDGLRASIGTAVSEFADSMIPEITPLFEPKGIDS